MNDRSGLVAVAADNCTGLPRKEWSDGRDAAKQEAGGGRPEPVLQAA